jgi:hypothetical protein
MTLSRLQRGAVAAGLVVMAALAAFPPWRCVDVRFPTHPGYTLAPLWAPPPRIDTDDVVYGCDDTRVAGDRLLASWAAVAALAAALAVAAGARRGGQG